MMAKRISVLALIIFLLSYPTVMSSSSTVLSTPVVSSPFAANVRLGISSQNRGEIFANEDTVTFTQHVATTSDVPSTAAAKVDFTDSGRPAGMNGISEFGELRRLPALGLAAIDLDYRESRRIDEWGNWFRYRAKVRDLQGAQLGRWAWDVFLLIQ